MKPIRTLILAGLLSVSGLAMANSGLADGEIRKIDKEAGKLTIKHGELKNLGMMPMVMVFKVKDKAMLEQVKQGDKVRFAADRIDGAITVTMLEAPAAK